MSSDPVAARKNLVYGQNIEAGRWYRLGTHPITEQELIEFATAWDPQGFHIDKAVAEDGTYGGLIASGLHTLAVYQRLAVSSVFADWSVIAGRTLREVRFLRPVRPGDTLSGTLTVKEVVDGDHNRTLVTTWAELTNQHRKPVLNATVDAYVHTRSRT
ncbi:MaoC/PaaZ C-terminal domain-containing protein (plasmid) [Rhodococcus pyridinivorans]|uniref:MaoC/PaaZ C-terminal domain-containing protein n=1 Tax=Rhodococcus TaxID=1827 RepID=UPI000EB086D7|nr:MULTISPECIES: MaoC/PaaZ C-terminal domain-containing protein [Rhodococcus]MCT7293963.1 MaoC/PaaZ C-terminal domain-containing protein [Rhodococcus sp. PAE-6]UVT27782.1 MaoC/PaaZ C-terminal domain-containing protein [Rhodococcus pyridinivorans]